MKSDELKQTLIQMQKDTQAGKLKWRLFVQTTEGNENKYTVEENKETWTVDECYVSYDCTYRGREFSMITYEMIRQSGGQVRTVNYVFLPPRGIHLFSLHTLLDYSIEANATLFSQIHSLWEVLMDLVKQNSSQVDFRITEAEVHVEEDFPMA